MNRKQNDIFLTADENKLKQALINILLNAIDAMPDGGTLTIATKIQTPNTLAISILDSGCGIQQEDLKHIFEPFFSKKQKGTGLGLAITKGIIEDHGGKILVESNVGEGTTFTLEFPMKETKQK